MYIDNKFASDCIVVVQFCLNVYNWSAKLLHVCKKKENEKKKR